MIWEVNDSKGLPHEQLSPVNFVDYRGLSQVFDDPAAWWYPRLTLTETGREPMRVKAIETTPNFFSVIGVGPVLGAGFPAAPSYSREGVVVISHRLWRERFNSDPAIIGTSIALNEPLFTVVGVMSEGFQYPNDTDVWHRITWDVAQHSRAAHFMEAIVRLKPGLSIDAVNNEVRSLTRRLAVENPSTNGSYSARVVPLETAVVGFFRPALLLSSEPPVFCSSSGGARNLQRAPLQREPATQELGVRMALGAQPRDVLWLVVRHGLWRALVGGAAGIAGALAIGRALSSLLYGVSAVDAPAFAVATTLALVTAFAACLLPARRAASLDPLAGLRAD